jgi:hypothetical protein
MLEANAINLEGRRVPIEEGAENDDEEAIEKCTFQVLQKMHTEQARSLSQLPRDRKHINKRMRCKQPIGQRSNFRDNARGDDGRQFNAFGSDSS